MKILTRRSVPPLAVVTVFTLVSCAAPRLIRIDGSTGVLPLVMVLAQEYTRESRDSIAFGVGLGSSARIQAVAESRIDVAMASHGVDTSELRRRGLVAHEIARTAVIIGVHESVNVGGITRAQLCEVYAGRITTWRELGGTDGMIIPLMRPLNEVDAEVALEGIPCLRGLQLTPTVRTLGRPEEMAAALATTPGAMGITSMIMAVRSGRSIRPLALDGVGPTDANLESGAYALMRRSILVTRDPTTEEVRRFLAFVRGVTGTRLIRANGAVPARATGAER